MRVLFYVLARCEDKEALLLIAETRVRTCTVPMFLLRGASVERNTTGSTPSLMVHTLKKQSPQRARPNRWLITAVRTFALDRSSYDRKSGRFSCDICLFSVVRLTPPPCVNHPERQALIDSSDKLLLIVDGPDSFLFIGPDDRPR